MLNDGLTILLLNQYGPQDAAPTARLLTDLAEEFSRQGCAVRFVYDKTSYTQRARGWRRWVRELRAHGSLLAQGLAGQRPDLIISLTSPVCLVVTGAVLAFWHQAKHIHWAMDIYPDLAYELGEIKAGLLFKGLQKMMRTAYAQCHHVVALDEDMQDAFKQRYELKTQRISPWPSVTHSEEVLSPEPAQTESSWTWLYSGNLGRAHEWETLLKVQIELEKDGVPATLVFQGDGAGMENLLKKVAQLGLKRCQIRPYVRQEEFLKSLLQADVLIVTRKPQTCGLLWPSKCALVQELPRPLLWVGEVKSHYTNQLRQRKAAGVFAPDEVPLIKAWLIAETAHEKAPFIYEPKFSRLRKSGLRQWVELVNLKN